MFRLDREAVLTYPLIFLWAVLGFQAGFINSIGFLACGRYVSHVTGVGSQIGVALGTADGLLAFELLGYPLAFILGAAVSGFFTVARLERGLKPKYDLIAFFLPISLVVLSLAGLFGAFGQFGTGYYSAVNFELDYMLSFFCGMQNGCFAALTKGLIRTTHLTGISTDLGTDLARYFFSRLDKIEKNMVLRANISRAAIFIAFSIGGISSALVSPSMEFLSLLIPAVTSVGVACAIVIMNRQMERDLAFGKEALWLTPRPFDDGRGVGTQPN